MIPYGGLFVGTPPGLSTNVISSFAHTSRLTSSGAAAISIAGANIVAGASDSDWNGFPCTDEFYDTGF